MLNIIYEEDGRVIKEESGSFNSLPNDIKYKEDGNIAYNFVGFIIKDNKMLAVFPKHFFDNPEINLRNTNSIKLMFEVLKKFSTEEKTKSSADKFIGNVDQVTSDYPFAAFYKVYEYYKKYGIYREENFTYNKNSNGKVSWKQTIQKFNKVISNGNLIYLPLISRKQNFEADFISECMLFVINYTIKTFPYFLDMKPIDKKVTNFDFLTNKKYVIQRLQKEKARIFKDNQIKLVNDLIEFFEQLDKLPKGGVIHFKINYFNVIWENMVAKYLNDYFAGVDTERREILFDYSKRKDKNIFEYQKSFKIDDSINKFSIQPDYFYEDIENNSIYVFDSKYYTEINELNYKQLVYTIIIGNSIYGNGKKLYSTLILPGNKKSQFHIDLSEGYKQWNEGCNKIVEQYLDVNRVMLNYLNKEI